MKQRYSLLIAAVALSCTIQAQTLWTETFTNGCSAGCLANAYTSANGAWSQTITGTEGADPNTWFVSCAENGNGAGNCGTACASTQNATLHVSAAVGNPVCPNDCGASYDAGGLCGLLTCPQTSRRIESPVINCSSATSAVAVSFVYMAAGSVPSDQCSLWYHDGTNWSMVQVIPPTANSSCGNQGMWTSLQILLPASAIGNANVKIGFEWVNNDDGVGTDPSFAVDDVEVIVATSLSPLAVTEAKVTYDATSDQISISTGSGNSGVTTAELYTIDGRLVQSQQLTSSVSVMDVKGFATGVYVVRLTAEGKNFAPVKLAIE